jgi:chromosome segregation ATPase
MGGFPDLKKALRRARKGDIRLLVERAQQLQQLASAEEANLGRAQKENQELKTRNQELTSALETRGKQYRIALKEQKKLRAEIERLKALLEKKSQKP